jgi:formylglycine-generating enzyme required for sulfatase activity/serine/threonine protein kinase
MAARTPRLADQFGRYRIVKRLGQGGMGSVYLAQDTHLERRVALKVPDFGDHDGPAARRRFLEEARTAATLDHPYLCRVYETGEIEGQPYLTMAYIEGQSLAALIGEESWPQRQVAALVGKLALAMQEAHSRKIVHRDLKPANVMIKTSGGRREPVIVDFGLAHRDNPQEQRLTRSGQIMGTLAYMAPEQIRGDLSAIGPACDIYALGVILYELLTGRAPFSGQGLAVAGQILSAAPLPPSTHRSDLDPTLETICLKAMAKPVGDRYASMAELAAALTGFIHSLSATPTPTEAVGSDGSPSPTSNERPKPAGSDSLVHQFLGQLVENDPSPSPIPTPKPDASRSPLHERRWPSRRLIAAAAALGILIVSALIYVTSNTGFNKKIDAGASMRTNEPVLIPKSTAAAVRSSAEPLFNGSDLKGWEFDNSDARTWRVEDQTLVAIGRSNGQGQPDRRLDRLLTERSFSEFIFRFDYQSLSDLGFGAVWWTLPGEMPPLYNPTASTFAVATNRNSAWLFSNAKPSELKEGEGWNVVEVEARDRLLRISVNGKEIIRKALPEKPAEPIALRATKPDGTFPRVGMDRRNGRVGFQVLKGTGRFRNIEIEELPRSAEFERTSLKAASEDAGLVDELAVKAAELPKPHPTVPDNQPKPITNSIEMKLVLIPPGTFLMGSPDTDFNARGDETPPHTVRITRPFYLGVTEVTVGQFRRFIDDAHYQTVPEKDGKGGLGYSEETKKWLQLPRYTWKTPGFEQTDEHPVTNVTWNDAVAFAQWLGHKEGKIYRLPTEAEWEYACRAGTTTRFSNGDNLGGVVMVGNVKDQTAKEKNPNWGNTIADRDGYVYAAPVGRFQPNAFGLYDMHGNVGEWCADGYDTDYYQQSPGEDPPGPLKASERVVRGGGWFQLPQNNRSGGRWQWPPGARYSHLGFRVVLVSSGP